MTAAENLYERIDAYLKGDLSEADKLTFEAEMQVDVSLKEEVELQKLVHTLILEKGLTDIRNQVGKDLSIQKNFPWGEISFIILSVFVTGALCYLWFEPFKKNNGIQRNIHEVTIEQNSKQGSRETKTNLPVLKLKGTNTPVSDGQAKPNTIVLSQSSVQQERQSIQGQDTIINVVQHASSLRQTNVHTEEKKTEPVPVTCPDILFNVRTQASCRNSHTGSIQLLLSDIQGGLPPYTYTIDEKSNSILTDLAAGTYMVAVQDKRGCLSEKQVTVTEKNCTVFKDYSFNPNIETWKFPFADMERGSLSIMDKAGNLVYKTDIMNGQPYEWNGRSLNGSSLEIGSYLYIATFTNGESRQGYIVILE